MISLEDCIGLCGLTEQEVLAIAEHEHLPEIAATALAQYVLSQEHGTEKVRDIIIDDIQQAQRSGDKRHVLTFAEVRRKNAVIGKEWAFLPASDLAST
jgi:hypothetical protein